MSLSEIINVTISRETTAVSQAGFGTALIMAPNVVFTELTRTYTSAASMLTDGFESTDAEYIAANAIFSQNPKPTQVKIGRRQVDLMGISVDTAVNDTVYTVTVNGVDYPFTSDATATVAEIAAGLVGLINGGSEPVTATDDLDGTFTIAADVAGVPFSVSFTDTKMSYEKPYTEANTVAIDLANIQAADDDWYALIFTSRVPADVQAAALWVESQRKIFVTASNDADILDSASTTDIAYTLNNAAYDRTAVIYSGTPATFPDAAWLGKQLPTTPGASTWNLKTLATIAADTLTPTQSINARAKEANVYQSVNGVNITREGTMASGEFIDIIHGVDWLQARLEERIYSRLVNLPKVPFTNQGIAIIEGEISAQLNEGIDNGLLSSDVAYSISVPLSSNVSSLNKANRVLPDITFTATLQGAIHSSTIAGVVTV